MNHRIQRSALIEFPAEHMFALVNDIERYPEFLPWCSGAQVLTRTDDSLTASLEVAKGAVRQKFTTRNSLRAPEEIRMQLVEGPFAKLEGCWGFKALSPDACKVELHLNFSIAGALGKFAFERVFAEVTGTMVEAFCQRATVLKQK